MNKYIFQLGRTPDLSVRELVSCGLEGSLIKEQLYQVERDAETDQASLVEQFNNLGGSLKLLKVVGEFADLSEEDLITYIAAYFAQFERPTFAVGELYRDNIAKIQPTDVKSALKERGVGSRFIDAPRDGLSASVLLHQEVEELIVIRLDEHTTLFGQTLGVQNIDEWTIRDRQKPYADRKKGMLPPKVARMMLNIGRGELAKVSDAAPILYDPFCGTGTVLIEGLVSGLTVVGTDLDANSAMGTTENLEWLAAEYHLDANFTVFQADVSHVMPAQLDEKPNLIVTEPFLGKPKPNHDQLANMFRGMEKLYLGAFRQWRRLLADTAIVTIIFPMATDGKHTFSLESIIDKLATLGYTPTSDPCLYHRPQAVIQRQVWTFQFKKSAGEANAQ
jgi:tRNA G10  N-methylase Trm11